jgi:hypothetical protein
MHVMLGVVLSAAVVTAAVAQSGASADKPPRNDSESTGQTNLQSHQEHREQQPQGSTGPLNTTTGGAPAESPQGQTPPGMQAAPEGSSKSIIDNDRR